MECEANMDTTDIIFPVPLSNGHIVTINNLPVVLSIEDAEKISRVIIALAEQIQGPKQIR